jgi:hypothetical protein
VSLNGTPSVTVAGTANVSVAPGALVGIDPAANAVQLAGTPSVAISGTPTVSVAQLPPVALAGTPTVSVAQLPPVALAGTPAVSVAQLPPVALAGTPTVAVAQLPPVSISGQPSVNVASMPQVQLANDTNNPLWVRNLDEPARQPFQQTIFTQFASGDPFSQDVAVTIPAGATLVVEFVSAVGVMPAGQSLRIHIETPNTTHYLLASRQGVTAGNPNTEDFVASQQLRLYFTKNDPLTIKCARADSTTGTGYAYVTLSGYLYNP